MSRINGEKARANITHKKRTARREKERALRAQLLEESKKKNPVAEAVEKVAASKPARKAVDTVKRAGDALAELAEMAKPKKSKKAAEADNQ